MNVHHSSIVFSPSVNNLQLSIHFQSRSCKVYDRPHPRGGGLLNHLPFNVICSVVMFDKVCHQRSIQYLPSDMASVLTNPQSYLL